MNDTCKDEYQEGEDITDRVYVRRRSVTNCLCIHCGEDFDEARGLRHPRHKGMRCLHLRCWLERRGGG